MFLINFTNSPHIVVWKAKPYFFSSKLFGIIWKLIYFSLQPALNIIALRKQQIQFRDAFLIIMLMYLKWMDAWIDRKYTHNLSKFTLFQKLFKSTKKVKKISCPFGCINKRDKVMKPTDLSPARLTGAFLINDIAYESHYKAAGGSSAAKPILQIMHHLANRPTPFSFHQIVCGSAVNKASEVLLQIISFQEW